MRSRQFGCALLVACALMARAVVARAQDVPLPFQPATSHYRVLPRLSELHQTGGFAGFDLRYRVIGDFDFKVEQSPLAVFPPIFSAQFVDPDLHGIHPNRDNAVDVDQVLNLDDLRGTQALIPPRHPNLFTFKGETDDGSSVELNVLRRGPWLYMRGGTTPPPGSADFFQYQIRMVARRAPIADLNDDGVVDAGDLKAWAAGKAASGGDFLEWQRQLGEQAPTTDDLDGELNAALAAAGASLAAVPEPASSTLLLAAGAMLATRARRRQR